LILHHPSLIDKLRKINKGEEEKEVAAAEMRELS
jgi:hypothetical protein